MLDHKNKLRPGSFTAKYDVTKLVWYEMFETRSGAFHRERAIKKWYRRWKLDLIEAENPDWNCLLDQLGPAIE